MIKTKFGFFQVKIKSTLRHAIEFCQTSFCETPERFVTVNMAFAIDTLTIPVMNPEMLIKADIDQSIITTPSIRMDHGIWRYMSADNGLQRCFRTIRNNLRIHFTLAFENPENDRFAVSTSTSLAPDSLCTKIRLVNLYRTLQRRFKLTTTGDSLPYFKVNAINGSNRDTGQFRCTRSSEIQRKASNKLPEFRFSNSRTKVVSIFTIHLSKLTHLDKCLTS